MRKIKWSIKNDIIYYVNSTLSCTVVSDSVVCTYGPREGSVRHRQHTVNRLSNVFHRMRRGRRTIIRRVTQPRILLVRKIWPTKRTNISLSNQIAGMFHASIRINTHRLDNLNQTFWMQNPPHAFTHYGWCESGHEQLQLEWFYVQQ